MRDPGGVDCETARRTFRGAKPPFHRHILLISEIRHDGIANLFSLD